MPPLTEAALRASVRRCFGQSHVVEHELREFANGLLPFTFAPDIIGSFQAALSQTGTSRYDGVKPNHSSGLFRPGEIASAPNPNARAPWTAKHWSDLERFVETWSQGGKTTKHTSPAFREVGDGTAVLARLAEIELAARPKAEALLGEELARLAGV